MIVLFWIACRIVCTWQSYRKTAEASENSDDSHTQSRNCSGVDESEKLFNEGKLRNIRLRQFFGEKFTIPIRENERRKYLYILLLGVAPILFLSSAVANVRTSDVPLQITFYETDKLKL